MVELFINEESYREGISGREEYYRSAYIELIYTLYRLFGWGLRQITGYFKDLWHSKGLKIDVPSFGNLSDLFGKIPLKIRHFCNRTVERLKRGERVTLILDSTGIRFNKASSWYEEKYGKSRKKCPWRKLHISADPGLETYASELTECNVDDREMINQLTDLDGLSVEKVIADTGYYSIDKTQQLHNRNITPVIPPPPNSVVHGKPNTAWHDKIVEYIKSKETVYAFYQKYGYNLRCKIETQNSRIKRCFGESLQTIKLASQKNEV